ncbi:CDP-archaeol synthase [Marinobacter sp. chi1]|uniref:CDP-archaeol synthase n=1 Tax=Marinobacter suaedae TaxID=3057675 RepID=A0ABT8VY89_9GAMM|nr:CDP-archaeol synthase [Marinobacter sp. chi1]MDO3720964.1 CDP-archaeol synthase [Marinobacter sp. chi1]
MDQADGELSLLKILLELFVMLVLANGAPVVAARLFRRKWAAPVDGGRLWSDGRRVLGKSKTWRGLAAGSLSCALFSWAVGLGFMFGLLFGALGLLGDLLSSFTKRRMGLDSSARAVGLDQVPESLLPMILAVFWGLATWWGLVVLVLIFTVANILFSPLLYQLGIRRHPH